MYVHTYTHFFFSLSLTYYSVYTSYNCCLLRPTFYVSSRDMVKTLISRKRYNMKNFLRYHFNGLRIRTVMSIRQQYGCRMRKRPTDVQKFPDSKSLKYTVGVTIRPRPGTKHPGFRMCQTPYGILFLIF